jgi:hypothetical protein
VSNALLTEQLAVSSLRPPIGAGAAAGHTHRLGYGERARRQLAHDGEELLDLARFVQQLEHHRQAEQRVGKPRGPDLPRTPISLDSPPDRDSSHLTVSGSLQQHLVRPASADAVVLGKKDLEPRPEHVDVDGALLPNSASGISLTRARPNDNRESLRAPMPVLS